MPSTGRTRQATVIIIPGRTEQVEPDPDKPEPAMHKPHPLTVLLSLLALFALLHFIASMHAANPAVVPINCQGLLRTTDYGRLVHLQPRYQEMGAVQFTNQLVDGQAAALVEVTNSGSQPTLDVYVYGCSMSKSNPTLLPLFTQRGLINGTASINAANTLITGELDTALTPQTLALALPLQQNVYREYRWQRDRFVQITFPGLYPVSSRSEAEALQQQANSGQLQPWSDPLTTAEQMAKDVFRWPAISPQDAVLQNNGVFAQVQLVQESLQMRVIVTLKRLLQQNKMGLWFVTSAQSPVITQVRPSANAIISSPAAISSTGAPPNGQVTATLFDHTLTPLTQLNNSTFNVAPDGTYAGSLFYKESFPQQPGLLLIQSLPPAGSDAAGQLLLLRVILG